MIIAERKPFEEIQSMLQSHRSILVVGCHGCVTICQSGGELQTQELVNLVRLWGNEKNKILNVTWAMVERQCEIEFITPLKIGHPDIDAILSLGCGVGVQTLADLFPALPIYPGLNTKCIGMISPGGDWEERCQACGNCILHLTAGICPISRCAKSMLNGPCGGSQAGNCELGDGRPCAWALIYRKLEQSNQVENLLHIQPARNWFTARDGGPRRSTGRS